MGMGLQIFDDKGGTLYDSIWNDASMFYIGSFDVPETIISQNYIYTNANIKTNKTFVIAKGITGHVYRSYTGGELKVGITVNDGHIVVNGSIGKTYGTGSAGQIIPLMRYDVWSEKYSE